MVRVKICGITSRRDAAAAVEAGADAVGFVFHRASPRYVEPAAAREIVRALPPFVTPVGVFHGESGPVMRRAVRTSGVRLAQMPGDTPERIAAGVGVPVMRAVRVRSRADVNGARKRRAALLLFDGHRAGVGGGTGTRFAWTLLRGAQFRAPVMLAGGLTPGNVGRAIRTARPFGVDVSSGVERRPGVKDHALVRRFIRAARRAG